MCCAVTWNVSEREVDCESDWRVLHWGVEERVPIELDSEKHIGQLALAVCRKYGIVFGVVHVVEVDFGILGKLRQRGAHVDYSPICILFARLLLHLIQQQQRQQEVAQVVGAIVLVG